MLLDGKKVAEKILGDVKTKVQTLTIITNILLNPYSLYFLIVLPIKSRWCKSVEYPSQAPCK